MKAFKHSSHTMGRTGVRACARELGLPVPANSKVARIVFIEGNCPIMRLVNKMWSAVEQARSGRAPYTGRQPFSVIEALVEENVAVIWCHGDRSHLLKVGEEEHQKALYWPENRVESVHQILQILHAIADATSSIMAIFRKLYDVRQRKSTKAEPLSPLKRKRSVYEETFDGESGKRSQPQSSAS